jgi:hypothetical protein
MEQIGARFLIMPAESRTLSHGWDEAGFIVRTHIDLAQGCETGLWSKYSYRAEQPHLLMLEAPELQASLTLFGTILEMSPNRLLLELDEKGEAIIRLLYSDGWRSSSEVTIDSLPGAIPWIRVRGKSNSIVELTFECF